VQGGHQLRLVDDELRRLDRPVLVARRGELRLVRFVPHVVREVVADDLIFYRRGVESDKAPEPVDETAHQGANHEATITEPIAKLGFSRTVCHFVVRGFFAPRGQAAPPAALGVRGYSQRAAQARTLCFQGRGWVGGSYSQRV
jgi:hypothetical protein